MRRFHQSVRLGQGGVPMLSIRIAAPVHHVDHLAHWHVLLVQLPSGQSHLQSVSGRLVWHAQWSVHHWFRLPAGGRRQVRCAVLVRIHHVAASSLRLPRGGKPGGADWCRHNHVGGHLSDVVLLVGRHPKHVDRVEALHSGR